MKIKIFEHPDKTEIEQKVNSLCKEHEVSRIKLTTTPSKTVECHLLGNGGL